MNNHKRKICYVVEAASAGVGGHVADLIQRLSQRDVAEIHVLWSPIRADQRFIDQLDRPGVYQQAIHMQRSVGPSDLASLAAERNYLEIHGPFDIVHGHSSKGGALARLAALGTGDDSVNGTVTFNVLRENQRPQRAKPGSQNASSNCVNRLISGKSAIVNRIG